MKQIELNEFAQIINNVIDNSNSRLRIFGPPFSGQESLVDYLFSDDSINNAFTAIVKVNLQQTNDPYSLSSAIINGAISSSLKFEFKESTENLKKIQNLINKNSTDPDRLKLIQECLLGENNQPELMLESLTRGEISLLSNPKQVAFESILIDLLQSTLPLIRNKVYIKFLFLFETGSNYQIETTLLNDFWKYFENSKFKDIENYGIPSEFQEISIKDLFSIGLIQFSNVDNISNLPFQEINLKPIVYQELVDYLKKHPFVEHKVKEIFSMTYGLVDLINMYLTNNDSSLSAVNNYFWNYVFSGFDSDDYQIVSYIIKNKIINRAEINALSIISIDSIYKVYSRSDLFQQTDNGSIYLAESLSSISMDDRLTEIFTDNKSFNALIENYSDSISLLDISDIDTFIEIAFHNCIHFDDKEIIHLIEFAKKYPSFFKPISTKLEVYTLVGELADIIQNMVKTYNQTLYTSCIYLASSNWTKRSSAMNDRLETIADELDMISNSADLLNSQIDESRNHLDEYKSRIMQINNKTIEIKNKELGGIDRYKKYSLMSGIASIGFIVLYLISPLLSGNNSDVAVFISRTSLVLFGFMGVLSLSYVGFYIYNSKNRFEYTNEIANLDQEKHELLDRVKQLNDIKSMENRQDKIDKEFGDLKKEYRDINYWLKNPYVI